MCCSKMPAKFPPCYQHSRFNTSIYKNLNLRTSPPAEPNVHLLGLCLRLIERVPTLTCMHARSPRKTKCNSSQTQPANGGPLWSPVLTRRCQKSDKRVRAIHEAILFDVSVTKKKKDLAKCFRIFTNKPRYNI